MSKAINLLFAFLLIPLAFVALMVGFDLNALGFIQGLDTPYFNEICLAIGILVGIVFMWQSFRRWGASRIFKNKQNFEWIGSCTSAHIGRMRLYVLLEMIFYIFVSGYFLWVTPATELIGYVFAFFAFERLLFAIFRCNKKNFLIGFIKNGMVLSDRDLSFFYFSGLKSVSTQNESIYLEYNNDLCLALPIQAINEEDRATFLGLFLNAVDKKRVFVSEKVKEL